MNVLKPVRPVMAGPGEGLHDRHSFHVPLAIEKVTDYNDPNSTAFSAVPVQSNQSLP